MTLEAAFEAAIDAEDLVGNVYFHGSGNTEFSIPHVGSDGLFWLAECPIIAQTYIPECGIKASFSANMPADARIVPNLNDHITNAVLRDLGLSILNESNTYDIWGRAVNYIIKANHPTYALVYDYLEGVGYQTATTVPFKVKMTTNGDGTRTVRPADFRKPGKLFIISSNKELNFKDIRTSSEPDLTEYAHLNHAGFDRAYEQGYDGVIINDFAQHSQEGNIPHVSYGLFSTALPFLETHAISARHPHNIFKAGSGVPMDELDQHFDDLKEMFEYPLAVGITP